MKIWTSDHVFEWVPSIFNVTRFLSWLRHPWETVVHAAFRKYPNPMNKAITAIDVVRQDVDKGVIKSERLLESRFHIPSWVTKVGGLFNSAAVNRFVHDFKSCMTYIIYFSWLASLVSNTHTNILKSILLTARWLWPLETQVVCLFWHLIECFSWMRSASCVLTSD